MRELTNISAAVLDPLLANSPSAPRITYYDDATGERIELSTTTLYNWAAKTGNLLRDELGAGPGSRVAVLLPPHWQTVGVLLGIWYVGAEVVLEPGFGRADCDIACCTAAGVDEADASVGPGGEVVAFSLDAFGKPIAELPFGITDYATSVRVHGDQIAAERQPGPALAERSTADVLTMARTTAAALDLATTDRVMSTLDWSTAEKLTTNLLSVLVAGASLVQVANAAESPGDRRRAAEKVTRVLQP